MNLYYCDYKPAALEKVRSNIPPLNFALSIRRHAWLSILWQLFEAMVFQTFLEIIALDSWVI